MANHRIPLSEDERQQLLHMYYTRLRLFLLVYPIVVIYAFISAMGIDYRDKQTGKVEKWTEKKGDYLVSRGQMQFINALVVEVPLITMGYKVYRKRIGCLKKDADMGEKEMVPYTIVRKSFFSLTDEYYISFDDPNYMHHKVDILFYLDCRVGDVAYLGRAPHSKYVFEKDGKFSLM